MNMRKLLLCLFLCMSLCAAYAENLDVMTSYIYSSDFNQARAGAAVPISYYGSVGVEGKYVEDKFSRSDGALKDPVYSVYVPFHLNLETAHFDVIPFYYFSNKPHQPQFEEASAYGVRGQLTMDLVQDEVEDVHTQAYVAAAYMRQKASVQSDNLWKNQYYDQAAFTLGVRQNFYSAFMFQADATAFQYPDGISQVQNFRGIVDQKDLAFVQSFDVNRSLGKYALSARAARLWAEKRSSLYVGYHYAEFYTADPQHSILIGNTFYLTRNISADMAFNHLQTTSNKNKRDLFFINLNMSF